MSKTKNSPTAQFLARALENSAKTQREIAKEAGFRKPNVLSMMKQGDMPVPFGRIPDLAEALEVSEKRFLDIALKEYEPELDRLIARHYGCDITADEAALIGCLQDVFVETGQSIMPRPESLRTALKAVLTLAILYVPTQD